MDERETWEGLEFALETDAVSLSFIPYSACKVHAVPFFVGVL